MGCGCGEKRQALKSSSAAPKQPPKAKAPEPPRASAR